VRGSEPGAEVGDAIQVMRLAEAARVYARQAELGTEAENAATSIRLKVRISRVLATLFRAKWPPRFAGNGHPVSRVMATPS